MSLGILLLQDYYIKTMKSNIIKSYSTCSKTYPKQSVLKNSDILQLDPSQNYVELVEILHLTPYIPPRISEEYVTHVVPRDMILEVEALDKPDLLYLPNQSPIIYIQQQFRQLAL